MNKPPNLACPAEEMAQEVVREERLELSRIAPLDPKSSAYASFATLAEKFHILQGDEFNTASRRRQEERRLSGGLRRRLSALERREISLRRFRRSSPLRSGRRAPSEVDEEPGLFPPEEKRGRRSKKGPPEDVPSGPGRGMRMTTRRKAVFSASPSWDRRA